MLHLLPLYGQLFVHPSSSSIPACVAQSKAGRCCPLLQILLVSFCLAMDIPLEHLSREQLAVLMSRIAAILAQPHGPGMSQMPVQNFPCAGGQTVVSKGGLLSPMPTAESWELKDDPWNRHLLEESSQTPTFGDVNRWPTGSASDGGYKQKSDHLPEKNAEHMRPTLFVLRGQDHDAGAAPVTSTPTRCSVAQYFTAAPAPNSLGAHYSSSHHGGTTTGDHCAPTRGHTSLNGSTWLNYGDLLPSGRNKFDEALPGSSNDVSVLPRKEEGIDHCMPVDTTGYLTEAEYVECCRAKCRECNAKCCLRRRGHALHKCLYHKIP